MLQIPMILALRKPQATVFTMFFAFGSKNHGIYSVFALGHAKTLVFTQFSPCCKI